MVLLASRYANSVARGAVLSIAAGLSFMLIARHQLALPHAYPPGVAQRIGSQAVSSRLHACCTPSLSSDAPSPLQNFQWDVALRASTPGQTIVNAESSSSSSSTPNTLSDFEDEDDDDALDDNDLGFARGEWNPFLAETTPITEIQIKTCMLPPGLYDLCSPTSSKKEDATRGEWKRVDRDLNKRVGIYYAYLYYRTSTSSESSFHVVLTRRLCPAGLLIPGSSTPVITNITLIDQEVELDSTNGVWTRVSANIREGIWPRMKPMYLYYRSTSQHLIKAARAASPDRNAGDSLEPITQLDVIYGGNEVQPLPGYTKLPVMISGGEDDEKAVGTGNRKGSRVGSTLAYRKIAQKSAAAPPLRFSAEGTYTILQVADLHLSVGPGKCRDLDFKQRTNCEALGADTYTLQWLETALDEVKPSLVVLSGDQLNGQDTSWSVQSTIMKFAPLIYRRSIPWTVVFGNHDGETTDLDLKRQIDLMSRLPYFVGEAGPSSIAGSGNYVRSVRASDSDTVLSTLYFLDSHANVKKTAPWSQAGYDFIKPDQINWFKGRSAQIHTLKRPYTPSNVQATIKGSKARPSQANEAARHVPRGSENRTTAQTSALASGSNAAAQREDPDWAPSGLDIGGKRMRKRALHARQDDEDADALGDGEGDDSVLGPDDNTEDIAKAIAVEEAGNSDEKIDLGYGMMPDDGANIQDAATGHETDTFVKGNPLLENEKGLEPTVLPVGPTRAAPLEAKPNALVFFHIPLQEAYDSPIDVGADGTRLFFGERLEGNGASKTDSGFFQQGLLAQKEMMAESDGPVDAFWDGESSAPTKGRPEVKVVANGHCHISEDCRRVNGIWLCFGGGASYSGYGQPGFLRRMRVYELSDYGETIETYHLLDTKQIIDRVVLVGEKAMGS
ncbi:BZ3500_MvSof-1268-A1-R1_Chr1-3g01997 [Microbotryum saponariae]|uniref:BZ3500_MvSof-1268-A1-R1_Chr1-3g01997 protein n=1 Tax=Microbotryum saponariae TaxID=289078 RepID=A0A2X0KN00_9BASI|nr:BZ3500_MvSof-1268-A1-R1_Chr1-3g01997 [Microbotryum saponariae]SCZ95142.1 BZ3501_MvSof-1269-A2-R1_Chr1-3g01599 [Microbotryum saponariae]